MGALLLCLLVCSCDLSEERPAGVSEKLRAKLGLWPITDLLQARALGPMAPGVSPIGARSRDRSLQLQGKGEADARNSVDVPPGSSS